MEPKPHKKLNELAATAICGNDITSSFTHRVSDLGGVRLII